jgi:hypothetical protein
MLWNLAAAGTAAAITNIVIDEWHWVGHPVISPDSKIMAAAARNGQIQLWNLATCRVGVRLDSKDLPVAFSPDNRTLLTRSPGSTLCNSGMSLPKRRRQKQLPVSF